LKYFIFLSFFLFGCSNSISVKNNSKEINSSKLLWPINCIPNEDCYEIGYSDINYDNLSFNCESPGYKGH